MMVLPSDLLFKLNILIISYSNVFYRKINKIYILDINIYIMFQLKDNAVSYLILVIICIMLAYLLGVTITRVVDRRLKNLEIKLPKQNIVVKYEGFKNEGFQGNYSKHKTKEMSEKLMQQQPIPQITAEPKKQENFTNLGTYDEVDDFYVAEPYWNEKSQENFFEGIVYDNKSLKRDIPAESIRKEVVQENYYNDTATTNGLEHFGNINHRPYDPTSDVNVYTKWLQSNKKNYHKLDKIHVENLFKVARGHKLTKKDIPESFKIIREGEEEIAEEEQAQENVTSCGCGI